MIVNGTEVEAVLNNSEMSRDFLKLLLLHLRMEDLFCREEFAEFPRSVSAKGNKIETYEVGDIAYWAH